MTAQTFRHGDPAPGPWPSEGFMTEAGLLRHPAHGAAGSRPRRSVVQRRGLALCFVLIIGDRRLSGAHRVSCCLDTVTVDFPETHIRVRLRPLDPDTRVDDGLVLEFSAEYRTDDGLRQGQPHSWRRVFTGRPGAFDQGEALLREIAAARSRASGRRVVRPVPVRPELASLRLLAAAV